jgi:hypothetical protein
MVVAGLAVAAVLELTGLVLTAVGFKRTWAEHAQGEDFWFPLKGRIRAAARGVERIARRVFRRSGRAVNLQVNSATMAVTAGEARVTITWGPLPDPSDGPAFAAKVQERLNQLHSMVQDDKHALADERKVRTNEDTKVRKGLAELSALVDAKTANVAVGGLRLQVLGWTFVLLGILVGSIVNLVDQAV